MEPERSATSEMRSAWSGRPATLLGRILEMVGTGRRRRQGPKGQTLLQAAYASLMWTYDFIEDASQGGR